jgi:dimethylaniline monooxygenase (N-oxide forming)
MDHEGVRDTGPPDSQPARGKTVCVVGAGIAGLVTAKVLRQDGFDVTVFEKMPTIGGVWAAPRTYPGLRTNNPRETYAFSDFPYPRTADEFPTAEQVREYLDAYVERFRLRPLLCLATEVVSISRVPAARFEVAVRPAGGGSEIEALPFDFVAVCNGVFSQPDLPDVPGRQRFSGAVLHSSELTAERVRGKHVVVVGAGKSALDCAMVAAEEGAACTLVFRRPHWMVPRYFFGRIRLDRLFVTRFAELLLPLHHRATRAERTLHALAAPLLRAWWNVQTRLVPRLCRMPAVMRPSTPLPSGLERSGVGDEFYQLLRQGRVRVVRSALAALAGPDRVQLESGEQIRADVVVLATGWRQNLSFLAPDLRQAIWRDGRFHLYRHILPPGEPGLGLIGYASSTACPFTSEVAAHWLSQCFRGELALPAPSQMTRSIAEVLEWSARAFPGRPEGFFIGPYLAHYVDDLMRDMGLRTRRTGNPLSEYLAPLWPERYRDIAQERRRRRELPGRTPAPSGSDSSPNHRIDVC